MTHDICDIYMMCISYIWITLIYMYIYIIHFIYRLKSGFLIFIFDIYIKAWQINLKSNKILLFIKVYFLVLPIFPFFYPFLFIYICIYIYNIYNIFENFWHVWQCTSWFMFFRSCSIIIFKYCVILAVFIKRGNLFKSFMTEAVII